MATSPFTNVVKDIPPQKYEIFCDGEYHLIYVSLQLQYEETDETITVPLKVLDYLKIDDYSTIKDIDQCEQIIEKNNTLDAHNRFIFLHVLNAVLKKNKCKHSAAYITLPETPVDYVSERAKILKQTYADEKGMCLSAVKYLWDHGLCAEKDYPLYDAVKRANMIAFDTEVKRQIEKNKGKIRVRKPYGAYTTWDGTPRSIDGIHYAWTALSDHSFLYPHVIPYASPLSLLKA